MKLPFLLKYSLSRTGNVIEKENTGFPLYIHANKSGRGSEGSPMQNLPFEKQ